MTRLSPRAHLCAAALIACTLPASAQTTDPVEKVGRLAINFDELRDWTPTWVFTNAMKIARPWIPQIPGSFSPWDTGAPIQTDSDGWPLLGFGQSAATILFVDIDGVYPGGTYNVFFDGNGTMEYGQDAKLLQHVGPGHDRIFVAPSMHGMVVKIATSNSNDHVRNVRVVMSGFETTYQSQTFHPEFLAELEPFGALRFMQWQNTNEATIQHWWQRPTPDTWTQSGPYGMAVEHMVELANLTKKAPWFCMPHTATNDFIREFARFVAQNLDQDVPAYVEYSNEVWNEQFPAWAHASANGLAAGYGAGIAQSAEYHAAWKWYAHRSIQVLDIWQQEFQAVAGPPTAQRLVRVLAAQHANPYVGETIINFEDAYSHADVLAVAPYVGYSFGTPQFQWQYVNKSVPQILDDMYQELHQLIVPAMVENVAVAQSRGLDLIAYEGGQHLVGVGSAMNNVQLTEKFIAVNRDPGMYDFYLEFLGEWDKAGADFMTPYSFCGKYRDFGSWGHKEYLDQPLSEAHKHRALVDWADGAIVVPPIPGSVSYYGTPCQNLWIGHWGEPKLGSTFHVSTAGVPPFGIASLMVSGLDQHYFGIPLPFDLSGLGQTGCTLLVGEHQKIPTQANGSGVVNLALPVPNFAGLAGLTFYSQWKVALPGFGPFGFGLSNALEVTIGN